MIFKRRVSHKSLLFHFTPHSESLQIIWNVIQYEPFNFLTFQSIDQSIFLDFINPLLKVDVFLLKNNYMCTFIIKLLI
jgi:hypothetical protein